MALITITIAVNRATGSMATSFLVWAKYRAFPQNDGDGVFVAEVPIDASATSVTYDWEMPNSGTDWKFIAIPKYMDQVGIPGKLESP